MKTFPTLYKKNSTGGIEQWTIEVFNSGINFPRISTIYGELNSSNLQTTSDYIKEGKNVGKKNETSAFEQAVKEAEAKWTKKLKGGYVQSLEAASTGKTDALILGGVVPMLAKSYSDDGHKIKFPCLGQPKLDGIRCIAVKKGNDVTLWTRTRKAITSCPHVIEGIREVFNGSDGVFDGELYNHKLKDQFEKIVSAVRKDEATEESRQVKFHIYDLCVEDTFSNRHQTLFNLVSGYHDSIKLVETKSIQDEAEVSTMFRYYQLQGYEGLMVRNIDGHYENKRSFHLQKVKEFEDAEFKIVGVEEGRGKLTGLLGAFVCITSTGETFKAKLTGDQERTREYINNPQSVIGKLLTVQFQGLTGKNGVPRFPIGLRIRDMEFGL